MTGKYASFAELASNESEGVDYRIRAIERRDSPVLVVAPHGGSIEVGTSEIATLIAGEEHSVFCFEGLKPRGHNRELHITSHCFDHPRCLALAARCDVAITVHGCMGEAQIFVGGLETELAALLAEHIAAAGFDVVTEGHRYPGRHPLNICNRGARGRGAQLEITYDLRALATRECIANAARAAIDEYVRREGMT
jgi:phage replication-related protein YjqB (UPF0714/DUF867 family)